MLKALKDHSECQVFDLDSFNALNGIETENYDHQHYIATQGLKIDLLDEVLSLNEVDNAVEIPVGEKDIPSGKKDLTGKGKNIVVVVMLFIDFQRQ